MIAIIGFSCPHFIIFTVLDISVGQKIHKAVSDLMAFCSPGFLYIIFLIKSCVILVFYLFGPSSFFLSG